MAILVCDVGGTKTVLSLYAADGDAPRKLLEQRYASADHPSLEAIIGSFLQDHAARPAAGAFGVAGPVHENRVLVTNLPWEVEAGSLSAALDGAPVFLLNDLETTASGIPLLGPDDVVTLKPGESQPGGPIAVLAPGTGLGEAFLFWDGRRYLPVPTEGGHTDFAPATDLEVELLLYLRERYDHVSYERVCSGGLGIPNLYGFLRDTGRYPEPPWLAERLAAGGPAAPVIFQAARERSAAICVATVDLFLAILGSEAGNLALQILATGGVYLAGGIPPRIVPLLQGPTFLEAFQRKGRLTSAVAGVPVRVVVNPDVALLGAAAHAAGRLTEGLPAPAVREDA